MKVIVLDDNDAVLHMAGDGFVVAIDKQEHRTNLTMSCNQLQLAEFLAHLMDELYGWATKDGMDDVVFLQSMAELANNVVRENRQEAK